MDEFAFQGIELLPASGEPCQLFVLLHGLGANASDLLPLAHKVAERFPQAVLLLPEGTHPFDGGGSGRQWYSNRGMTEDNRGVRVAAALPAVHALLQQAQQRYGIKPEATALGGFSQGAIVSLELCTAHDGLVGRVLAFSGRYAQLPQQAPRLTTIHLLHGEQDGVIPVQHAYAAEARLAELEGDVTLDVFPAVGHQISLSMAEQAVERLLTCIPQRLWGQALRSM